MRQEVANGDMNWIVPGKILAFKGPRTTPKNQPSYPPCMLHIQFLIVSAFYLGHLQGLGVKTIVRLNKNHYDKVVFTNEGVALF